MKWKVGDVVNLASGGPDMTVAQISASGAIHCVWFLSGRMDQGTLPEGTLVEVHDSSKNISETLYRYASSFYKDDHGHLHRINPITGEHEISIDDGFSWGSRNPKNEPLYKAKSSYYPDGPRPSV